MTDGTPRIDYCVSCEAELPTAGCVCPECGADNSAAMCGSRNRDLRTK